MKIGVEARVVNAQHTLNDHEARREVNTAVVA
jgi:hypothetical protein